MTLTKLLDYLSNMPTLRFHLRSTLVGGIFAYTLCYVACMNADPQRTAEENPQSAGAPSERSTLESPADSLGLDTSLEYLTGRFDPATHPDFVLLDPIHCDGPGMYLRQDAYRAFRRMYDSAQAAGIQLVIRSATRNFDRQKEIWERKWTGQTILSSGQSAADIAETKARALEILLYSSMPGTSRHHWGTDFDLNAFNNRYFEQGEGLRLYQWLRTHAEYFGFCQPYSAKGIERATGYEEEKWHWSYFPVSRILTDMALDRLKDEHIQGFLGAEEAVEIGAVANYIGGIHTDCQ